MNKNRPAPGTIFILCSFEPSIAWKDKVSAFTLSIQSQMLFKPNTTRILLNEGEFVIVLDKPSVNDIHDEEDEIFVYHQEYGPIYVSPSNLRCVQTNKLLRDNCRLKT